MGKLSLHQSNRTVKILNIGHSGTGKTGALACLAKAGYKINILDFDNGLDILKNLLHDDAAALDRVTFETFTDDMQATNGRFVAKGVPKAFTKAMDGLTKWKFPISDGSDETYNLGNIATWGTDTICVIDSLGLAAEAALRYNRQVNGNQFSNHIHQEDYGQAMDRILGMIQMITSNAVKCHLIVNSHITFSDDEMSGVKQGFPRTIGSKLSPKIAGYFNSLILTTAVASKSDTKRVFLTNSEVGFGLKLPVLPGTVPNRLPLENGLATLFETLLSDEVQWVEPEGESKDEAAASS